MGRLQTDFARNPHDALFEFCSVGVVPEFVVHSVQSENHQSKREFLVSALAEDPISDAP